MRVLLALAMVATLACDSGKTPNGKVERPNMDPGSVPRPDSIAVDSAQSSIYRRASYGTRFTVADTSTYTITYSIVNALGALDTVQVWLRRDSALNVPKISTSKYFRTLRGSATFKVLKIFNLKATYRACVRIRSNTVKSGEMCQVWDTNYLRAVPPPPIVDSMGVDSTLAIAKLDLKPDNVTVEVRKTQQFCAFVVFKGGKVAIRAPDKITDVCPAEYLKFPLAVRSVSEKQQQIADTLCVKWEATGGTISAETCGPVNPLTNTKLSYYIDHQMPAAVAAAILESVR